jgi:hypothetical protein
MKLIQILFLILLSSTILATKITTVKIPDPIDSNLECTTQKINSFGSYIYNYPSKYDLVFWPYTGSSGIMYCDKSGFASFINDFKLNKSELVKIKEYLKKNKEKPDTFLAKLKRVEEIYALREKTPKFRNSLKRSLAYLYESNKKFDLANKYRKEALKDLYELLKTELNDYSKLEYIYLSANYERQLGNIKKSDKSISKLKKMIKKIKEDKTKKKRIKNAADYFSKLIEDTKFIKKGGVLRPEIPKK